MHRHVSSIHDGARADDQMHLASLVNRIQRLEEALQQERTLRETALADERRARERDIRILREALHPFYRSEEEMRRKIVEVEDRTDGTYDEQLRLKHRIIALDDANMAVEKRLEEVENPKPKKRRTNRQNVNGVSYDLNSNSTDHSSTQPSSVGQMSPPSIPSRGMSPRHLGRGLAEPDEPRSSGILNLIDFPHPPRIAPTSREVTPREEVRSSGFLEISMAEQLVSKTSSASPRDATIVASPVRAHVPVPHPTPVLRQPTANAISTTPNATAAKYPVTMYPVKSSFAMSPTRSSFVMSPTKSPIAIYPADSLGRKRKWHDEMRPLDVLANLSAASPMV